MVNGSMEGDFTILLISRDECGLGAKCDESLDDGLRQSVPTCEMDAILTIVVRNRNGRGIAVDQGEDDFFRNNDQSTA